MAAPRGKGMFGVHSKIALPSLFTYNAIQDVIVQQLEFHGYVTHLADSLGVKGKFWVMGYSSGSIHAWVALKYIPNKVAGAVTLAPFANPYDSRMTREEMSRTWGKWIRRRKLFYLARRFPKFIGYFYHQTFLSGKHGSIDKWLSLSLGKKDKDLGETCGFEELWQRDVEESIRQGELKPFVEEAMLQVSDWAFALVDLQMQRKCAKSSIFHWLQFLYGQPECRGLGIFTLLPEI